jgi:hypothetical protein
VPVQVVRREIQHRRDPGLKQLGGLELEARHLAHDQAVGRELERVRRHGVPMLPADQHGARLQPEDRPRQRRGRRLAVRSGDRDRVRFGRRQPSSSSPMIGT